VEEVLVEKVVPGGDGLARVDGRVLLVPGALPGDRLRVEIAPDGTRLLRGRIVAVEEPGPSRRPDDAVCPRARDGSCGGCDWPAARLEAHRELKTSLVLDALVRIGRLTDLPAPRFLPSAHGYRLRNRLHVDGLGRVGFFAPRSNDVAEIETCEIVSPALLARLPAIRDAFRAARGLSGELQTLEGREGAPLLGELRVGEDAPAGVLDALSAPFDGFRVVSDEGRELFSRGPSSLTILAGGAPFRVSVSSFFQGNRHLLDAFLDEARDAIRSAGRVLRALDLYAGVGFLTRPLVEAGIETTAVEVDASSSADLRENLSAWKLGGRAVTDTTEGFLRDLRRQLDLVVLDPPRAGLSPSVRRDLLRLTPPSILVVSCDPATLARDLGALKERYRVERLVLFDLFPQTHHVETLVLLRRR